MYKIALVTPVKDEIKNLPKLFESMEKQSINIYSWVIIQNNSTDGSKEYLEKIKCVDNL